MVASSAVYASKCRSLRLWLSATHEICYTYDLLANFLFHVYMRTFPVCVAIAATKEAILSAIPSRHLSSAVKLYWACNCENQLKSIKSITFSPNVTEIYSVYASRISCQSPWQKFVRIFFSDKSFRPPTRRPLFSVPTGRYCVGAFWCLHRAAAVMPVADVIDVISSVSPDWWLSAGRGTVVPMGPFHSPRRLRRSIWAPSVFRFLPPPEINTLDWIGLDWNTNSCQKYGYTTGQDYQGAIFRP